MDDRNRKRGRKRPGRRDGGRSVTLRGMLIPTDMDADSDSSQVSVLTDDEDEYVVEGEHYTERLLKHLDDDVVIWGKVHSDGSGTKFIRVAGFEVVAWDEGSEEGSDLGDYWN